MINEIALVLLYGLFGWKVAAIYLGTGLVIAILSGWVIGRLKMEPHVEELGVQDQRRVSAARRKNWIGPAAFMRGWTPCGTSWGRCGFTWCWASLCGAGIHGYVPENFMASIMGKGAWWSVPLAVLIGIPMYSNAAGIIPVVQALLGKGAALGTVLAFMMAVIGLSLPETIILRKVLKPRLIATFIAVVGVGILLVGYLFNLLPLQEIVTTGRAIS